MMKMHGLQEELALAKEKVERNDLTMRNQLETAQRKI